MLRVLTALGIGAAAMYFFDPQQGRQRRALARDNFLHYRREAMQYAEGTAQDLRERAYGMAAEARGMVESRLGQRKEQPKVDIDLSQTQR